MLADDCLLEIFSYLNGYDMYAMKHVCHRLFHFVTDKMGSKIKGRRLRPLELSVIQSSIGFSILIRPFADDDYQYLFIIRNDDTETTELVQSKYSLYEEAITFSSSSREMQNIPNPILDKMVEILNRHQIRLVKFMNVSLSHRLAESMDAIQNYRKSVVFDSCYEHFPVRWGASNAKWISEWLLSQIVSMTIERCIVSCHFQDLLSKIMEHASKGTDHVLIMRENIIESPERKTIKNRLRNSREVGIWKLPVSTRRKDNFKIIVTDNPVPSKNGRKSDTHAETSFKNDSREFTLELTLAGSSVARGTMIKRDDNNRVDFTINNENILTANFKSTKW